MGHSDELLHSREATGLSWAVGTHLVVLGAVVAATAAALAGILEPGVVTETDAEGRWMVLVSLALGALAYWGFRLARRGQRLAAVGYGLVASDVVFIALMPVMWLATAPGDDPSPAFLMKNELFLISVTMMMVSTLALKPAYPALVGLGAVVVHLAVAVFTLSDPRVETTSSFHVHFAGAQVNPGVFTVRIFILAAMAGVLWLVARSARQLLFDAVQAESESYQMRERQAELLSEAKTHALASLVAGVAHELNTPLGALTSSLDTIERAAARLADETHDGKRPERVLRALGDSVATARDAGGRIQRMVGSLRGFVHLDEADTQRVDVRAGLESALALVGDELRGAAHVERDLARVPPVRCNPRELNQVFLTLIQNALEALGGAGTLSVRTRVDGEGTVEIGIDDDGPGIDPALLPDLFEIRLGEKDGRVGMSLGLPIARRIVERHGGRLDVESAPGAGTRFRITLPLAATDLGKAGPP